MNIESNEGKGLGRSVFARLQPGDDLMKGIKYVCEKHKIDNGVILSCIGSLSKAIFSYAKISSDSSTSDTHDNRLVLEGPLSLLPCQGLVCRTQPEGELSVHLHGLVQNNDMKVYGQDFAEEGNIVFNTIDLIIAEIGVDLVRRKDAVLPGLITSINK